MRSPVPDGLDLCPYFVDDDGTLPELELRFASPDGAARAFARLFDLGAVDASRGEALVEVDDSAALRTFAGPEDAARVAEGTVRPFHLVVDSIVVDGVGLPDLGVLVESDRLTFDYRMGPEWGAETIDALLRLLGASCRDGAILATPWWGADAERVFVARVAAAGETTGARP